MRIPAWKKIVLPDDCAGPDEAPFVSKWMPVSVVFLSNIIIDMLPKYPVAKK